MPNEELFLGCDSSSPGRPEPRLVMLVIPAHKYFTFSEIRREQQSRGQPLNSRAEQRKRIDSFSVEVQNVGHQTG